MDDFVGKAIRVGDKIAYFCSNQSGGISKFTFVVKGMTPDRVVVYDQQSFGRKKRYLNPKNCVVYREGKIENI